MEKRDSKYWDADELDAAIVQKTQYHNWGVITTNLHEVAKDITEFFKPRYVFVLVLKF